MTLKFSLHYISVAVTELECEAKMERLTGVDEEVCKPAA